LTKGFDSIDENPRPKDVDSNPTPRAYLGDLYDNIKSKRKEVSLRTKNLTYPERIEINKLGGNREITKKIISITKSCYKHYYRSILSNLAIEIEENAKIICDYLFSWKFARCIRKITKKYLPLHTNKFEPHNCNVSRMNPTRPYQ